MGGLGHLEHGGVGVMVAVGVHELPAVLAERGVGPGADAADLLLACRGLAGNGACVAAGLVTLHDGAHAGLAAQVFACHAGDLLEGRAHKRHVVACRDVLLDLGDAVGAVARDHDVVVEHLHHAMDALGGVLRQVGEDALTGFVLAIGEVELVADAPPTAQGDGANAHKATRHEVFEDERARLALQKSAVDVEGDNARFCHDAPFRS